MMISPADDFNPQPPQHCNAMRFQFYLSCFNENRKCRQKLGQLIDTLSNRRLFIDVGAGTGRHTDLLLENAERTVALEPDSDLRAELQKLYPSLEIWSDMIAEADIAPAVADFILCSHVLYFIKPEDWLETLETMASWLNEDGLLVVILAKPEGVCMSICEYFYDRSLDLTILAEDMKQKRGYDFDISMETVPAEISAPDIDTACRIAEFLLTPPPAKRSLPSRHAIEDYIKKYCITSQGEYRFSCDQYLLQLRA